MSNNPIGNNIIISEIKSNKNNPYTLCIFNNSDSNLEIQIKPVQNISKIIFSKKFTLEQIQQLSKYFLLCESITDIICTIKPIINKSNLIEKNGEIDIIIPINHPLYKEALFTIPQKAKDVTESINELYESINDLKKIINNQQMLINEQKNEIEKLNKRIDSLENKNNMEEYYDLNNSFILLNNQKYKESIKNWIDKNKKIKFKLIFRKSRDGSNSSNFHIYCDNQGATLCLIQTNKKYKFGGYSSIPWQNSYKLSGENEGNVFLFSLDLDRKYDKISEGDIQFSDKNYGPCFGKGGGCLYLREDLNKGFISNSNFLTNCELTHGEQGDFIVEEFEVFKVEFF